MSSTHYCKENMLTACTCKNQWAQKKTQADGTHSNWVPFPSEHFLSHLHLRPEQYVGELSLLILSLKYGLDGSWLHSVACMCGSAHSLFSSEKKVWKRIQFYKINMEFLYSITKMKIYQVLPLIRFFLYCLSDRRSCHIILSVLL